MNDFRPYIVVLAAGFLIGILTYRACNTKSTIIIDTVFVMSKPIIVIDSVPYPVYTGTSYISNHFKPLPVDTSKKDSCCAAYNNCFLSYSNLFSYSDSIIRKRYYPMRIENDTIRIDIGDSTLGTLDYRWVSYYIKPIRIKKLIPKDKIGIYGNIGYDLTTKNVLIGSDITYRDLTIGYLGNMKDQNGIKLGYRIFNK